MDLNKKIKALIIRAAIANEEAHKLGRWQREEQDHYYFLKEKYYSLAMKMIDGARHCSVHYYLSAQNDQNGFPSVLIYFQWKEDGKLTQFSFHKPLHGKKAPNSKGHYIYWNKINNARALRKCGATLR